MQATLASITHTFGAIHEYTCVAEKFLVNALSDLEEYAKSEALRRGAIETRRRVLGRDHREAYALCVWQLGELALRAKKER